MLLFLDGQGHYDTSRIGLKYSAMDSKMCTWSVAAEGRSGNCIKRLSTNSYSQTGYLDIVPLMTRQGVWTPTNAGVCGFAIKVNDLSYVNQQINNGAPYAFFVIMEQNDPHILVALNPTGTFYAIRGTASVSDHIIGESAQGLLSNTWMYVEIKWLLHATAGTLEIRVNGIPVLNVSGVNTLGSDIGGGIGSSGLGVWQNVRLLSVDSTIAGSGANLTYPLVVRMCDLYLADLTTAAPADVSDFLGDGVVETIMPNGVGASTGWTPTGTAANWDAVDDHGVPDDDSTYIRATAPGPLDVYQFEDIATDVVVKGVQVSVLARKETDGSAAVAPVVHQGSTDYLGLTQGVANILYDRYIKQTWDLNPASGAKFLASEINSGQFGVKKVI
jgi:hypothetical protein